MSTVASGVTPKISKTVQRNSSDHPLATTASIIAGDNLYINANAVILDTSLMERFPDRANTHHDCGPPAGRRKPRRRHGLLLQGDYGRQQLDSYQCNHFARIDFGRQRDG
ncbi:hypothetical protein KL921_004406 [Ogataea angusta]|nr:hypothetical protein KL921_004406 [Ogataea angusta]